MDSKIRIDHGIYNNYNKKGCPFKRADITLPINSFIGLFEKVCRQYDYLYTLLFTLGTLETPKYKIQAIAIVSPRDQFNRKLGKTIVEGRIRKTLGELQQFEAKLEQYTDWEREAFKLLKEKRPTVKVTEL